MKLDSFKFKPGQMVTEHYSGFDNDLVSAYMVVSLVDNGDHIKFYCLFDHEEGIQCEAGDIHEYPLTLFTEWNKEDGNRTVWKVDGELLEV